MNRETQNDPNHIKLARAIQALQQTRRKLEAVEAAQHEPIAIIGMGCHFPGDADSPERFWQNLLAGRDSIIELPDNRVKDMFGEQNPTLSINRPAAQTTTADMATLATYVLRGGFLAQVDGFEPGFFGLSPREVLVMDPAHRLLLETTWHALEDANLVPITLFNTEMGVFIGNAASSYTQFCTGQEDDLYKVTGNVASTAAGRLSYVLGLTGPCVSLDTACSSSLVAVHLACQSLRNSECNAALAGGVNIILEAGSSAMFANGNMLSDGARCKTFDAAADGYVRGEGCGMVVLKRLSDAQANGDRILAVIRGTAVNQDGPSGGLTVPNGPAQERVIRRALADANLKPEQIGYIEAHGTGTPLGDPIEIGALTSVFGARTTPLYVGSVKTNVGHLEMAAGVAGLMKLALAVQQGQIPPHLHLHTPNPHIDWAATPAQVPTTPIPWSPGAGSERIGGVSSFGFSGTNAHVVVAQAPQEEQKTEDGRQETEERAYHLLTIAARSEEALRAYAQSYGAFLSAHPNIDLGDLCYTSQVGRSHFPHRLSVTAASVAELNQRLAAFGQESVGVGVSHTSVPVGRDTPKVAFLFTGQGSQYVGMGRDLYESSATFRATLDRCEEWLRAHRGESLLAVLYPEQKTRDTRQETGDRLDDTTYTQPALFALEVALAELWLSWGVHPAVVMGHSVGELAAACVAGVFSLEDGLKLVAARGRLMGALPQDGAMVALAAGEARVQQAIAPYQCEVALAAVNGPASVVIAGQRAAVVALAEQLAAEGIKSHKLTVSHAFHSPLMAPMLAAFRQVAQSITYHAPKTPLIANVTGQVAGAEVTTPEYWVRHVREAVRFADGVATLQTQGVNTFLEIGPKPVLVGMVGLEESRQPTADSRLITQSPNDQLMLPTLRENQPNRQTLLTSLGELYTRGVAIDWAAVDKDTGALRARRKVGLPTYPFQRQRYWPAVVDQSRPGAEADAGFARWLAANPIAQLTDRITERMTGRRDGEDTTRATVAQVLAALEAEQCAQGLAAQIEALLYEVVWERQPKRTALLPSSTPGQWLILTADAAMSEALTLQLAALGESVTVADVTGNWTTLLTQAGADKHPLRGVLYFGVGNAMTEADGAALPQGLTQLMQSQEHNLTPLLQLCRHIVATHPAAQLWVITQGAQQLFAGEPIAVTQTPLWGMGRVIALEQGDQWGGLIDLDPAAQTADQAQWLLCEIWQPDVEEQVAYRAGERYVARLAPARPPVVTAAPLMQPDGAYLVTGGLGSLGLQTAQWLVEQGARHLILTGRRGVQSPAQQTILDRLQANRATVQIAQVDVADPAGMSQLFADIAAAGHRLRGVIHLAGVAGAKALAALEWADVERVLRPKVVGGWLLHCLTAKLNLDFFISYSSGAGIWGGKQQAHYGAANHFLDGLMAYRRSMGLPGLSIAWGPWASMEGHGGMATPEAQALLQAMGVRSFTPAQGLVIQAHLLRTEAISITAADIDWPHFKALYELSKSRRFLAHLATTAHEQAQPDGGTGHEAAVIRELQALPAGQRSGHLRRYLRPVVGQVLGLGAAPAEAFNNSTGFTDLGMDSLMALEVRRQLERDLNHPLPTTIALEYPTVDALAAYLLDLLRPRLGDEVTTFATAQPAPTTGRAIDANEPIAVLSMACRFPGADTPEQFWQLLQAGVDMVQPVPPSRWDVDAYYDPQRPMPGKMYTREAAFIQGVEEFDPLFFGIAPREATGMDPQHRLVLEVGWEALERAGIAPGALVDSLTGVFVGIGTGDYGAMGGLQTLAELNTHTATSSGHSIAAGRLAYALGLQGPALAVDTACSSSLVSLHLACQSLRNGECDLALAGGVKLMLSPLPHIALAQLQAISPDGRCKTFDAAADGYGRGEGCGLVVLKRLSDAERDGDPILAVIKGGAVNHNGPSSGLTVPNKRAQEKLLRQALAAAGVAPAAVGYIEAHGTGTSLGDPIEMRALGAVFGAERPTPLLVGSVKTNVAHLEEAAGVAGFIKTVLALQHGQIPPHLHFHTPNPYIEWDEVAIAVPTTLQPWPALGEHGQRVAGVSSFGLSGTNAHLIVAAAPEKNQKTKERREKRERSRHLLTLSTKSRAALPAVVERYRAHLQTHPEVELGDLCYTAAVGRSHFNQRLAIVATDGAELAGKLAAIAQGQETVGVLRGTAAPERPLIAFLFTGQGAQYLDMGRALFETQPVFRKVIERCDAVAQQVLGRSLIALLYPATQPDHNDLMESHPCGQAVNFAVQCALVEVWQAWGIQPDLVLGHSLGDFAAAYTAGVLSLEDGLRLVSERGRLMEQAVGSMVAVMGSEAEVAPFVAPYADVVIGVINGPRSVVISGGHDHVQAATAALEAAGFKTRKVAVPMAAHSPLLDPVLDEFETLIRETITLHLPQRPVVSSMTGKLVTHELTDPVYWRHHLRNPVRFVEGVETLAAEGATLFIEIGPKPTLLGMVEPILDKKIRRQEENVPASLLPFSSSSCLFLPSLRQHEDDWQQMLTALGELYVRGVPIDWSGFEQPYQRHKVLLPTYPFQRERYWHEPPKQPKHGLTVRPLIHQVTRAPLHGETIFETEFSVATLPFLADHRVYDTVVSPGACQLALVLSAAELIFSREAALAVEDVILPQALVIPEAGARSVQAVFTTDRANGNRANDNHIHRNAEGYAFQLISFAVDAQGEEVDLAKHATGYVAPLSSTQDDSADLAALRRRCDQAVDVAAFYAASAQAQIELGSNFRWLTGLWQGQGGAQPEALAKVALPEAAGAMNGYLLHPGLLDACFQTATSACANTPENGAGAGETWLPFAVRALRLHQPVHGDSRRTQWWCHAAQVDRRQWDIQLLDETGVLLVTIDGFEMRAAAPTAVRQDVNWRDWLYEVAWQPRPYFGVAPAYLPAPATITAALAQAVTVAPPADSRPRQAGLEALSIDYILAAFVRAGFTFRHGAPWRFEQIIQQISVIPSYRRLLYRLLGMLTAAGILRHELVAGNAVWTVVQTPATPDPAARLATLQAQVGDSPDVALLARCGEKLGEVLRGLQEPHALLYPNPTTEGATTNNAQSLSATGMNPLLQQAMQQAVQQVVAALSAGCGLRIIEVGAGAGAVTAALLPLLPAARIDYLFTDADAARLNQAQTRFADYGFMRYQRLELEQAPAAQGVGLHGADLVIAAHSLHATADVAQTLTHVRQLLQPGGQLLLLEATSPSRFLELTQGLSDRWWRFADDRQEQPLLTADQWQARLLANGFQAVERVASEGHALLIAQATVAARPEGAGSADDWLIFADQQGVGEALAGQLRRRGAAATLVYAGQDYQQVREDCLHIRADQPADYQRLMADRTGRQGIVHLWSLDPVGGRPSTDLLGMAQQSCGTALHLLQALVESEVEAPGLWLVTQDAQAATPQDGVGGVAQAALWGMGRVIALEHPELPCVRIDLAGAETVETRAAHLCAELLATGVGADAQRREEQVALRQEARYVARLTRHEPAQGLPIPDQPYRLEISERGTLDKLQLRPAARRTPLAGEVEIQVQASALNFRDLLNVLGLYPGDPGPLGAECAGVIVAVGPEVTGFAVGDEVLAMAPGSFSQYVTTVAAYVSQKPATLNACEAAGLPAVFTTAYYGLHEVGQIKAGDRVLIHAAAGGVGMAAVQLAHLAGAEVFVTASPGKWEALRAMGVTHLYHSRTVDFAAQILADTNGQGVDLLLNSLTGPGFMEANLTALAPGGYLVEMSKRDVWSAEQIAAVRPDVRYSLIDLLAVGEQQPELMQTLLAHIVKLYAEEKFTPLPYTAFPIDQAIAAFRYMQGAKHIGKIVLTSPSASRQTIQSQATYLITGGLGGIGLAVARWLAEQGARHLMLLGRSGGPPRAKAEVQPQLDALAALGVKLTIVQADVTVPDQVQAALQQIDAAYPLRGIIHAVGVLDDAALVNQRWERFARVLAPKLAGAWHLHELTRAMPLDFFVVFSSTAGLLGNRGQANHAAANAFLDAFVHYRRAQGLPALSINWGAWAEIGAAAELVRHQQQQMFAQGMGVITPRQGIAAFAYLLAQSGDKQRAPQVGVAPIHWAKFFNNGLSGGRFYTEFSQAATEQAAMRAAEPGGPVNLRQQLATAATAGRHEERDSLLQNYLRTAVARVLGLRNPEQIDVSAGLLDLGLDSLMAVELRNQIGRTLEMRLPATLIFDYPTIAALHAYLLTALFSDSDTAPPDETPPPVTPPPAAPPSTASADDQSVDEIAQLLAQLVYSSNQ